MCVKCYVIIEDMVWPSPVDPGDVEWRMRHYPETITATDMMHAASVMAAYRQMIFDPEPKRRKVVRAIRAAEKAGAA